MTAAIRNWPTWKRLLGFLSVAALIATIYQGVALFLPKDETTTETILFKAVVNPPEIPTFAVPVTAPFESFPSGSAACGAEQMAWLTRNGTPYSFSYTLKFRNTAKSGSNLAISNISSEGQRFEPGTPEVSVACENSKEGKGAAVGTEQGRLDVGTETLVTLSPPTETASTPGAQAAKQERIPLSYTLAPGEHDNAAVDVTPSHNFKGHFVATVASGKEEKTIPADMDGATDIFVPSFTKTKNFEILIRDGIFECQDKVENVALGAPRTCDMAELKQRLSDALK